VRVLIVKLSSLGDVVHAMPAVQDMRAALPGVRIDWVVEQAFAPLVQRCDGVSRVITSSLRHWRAAPLSRQTRSEWRSFRAELRREAYDAVIDLQGLTKSALVSQLARLAPRGKRYALANRTEGSSWEVPTRWVADVAVPVEPRSHAVLRSRVLCARALGYEVPRFMYFGLLAQAAQGFAATGSAHEEVALAHGSSRQDKCWPQEHWIALGRRLLAAGHSVGLPHGSAVERERSEQLAAALGPRSRVWPALPLGALADRLAGCAGVIGVDSGLSHMAVALDLPHVQIYNFDTAWRTGPPQANGRQHSVFAQPTPTVDTVWHAWQAARAHL